jgi:hypothetical protein
MSIRSLGDHETSTPVIVAGALASTADPTEVVALAHKQQRRIAAATR